MTAPNQRFAQVLATTWIDPAFLALDTDARLLFLWSFTQPRATACGLYVATVPELRLSLAHDDRVSPRSALWEDTMDARLSDALAQLARKPMLLYDEDSAVLWVVNRARHSNTSHRAQRLMQREYTMCPPSRLRDQFFHTYSAMLQLRGDDSSHSVRGGE